VSETDGSAEAEGSPAANVGNEPVSDRAGSSGTPTDRRRELAGHVLLSTFAIFGFGATAVIGQEITRNVLLGVAFLIVVDGALLVIWNLLTRPRRTGHGAKWADLRELSGRLRKPHLKRVFARARRHWVRVAIASVTFVASLTAGISLGTSGQARACGTPAELRILTTGEDLSAIQAAIPGFEQYEPGQVGSPCFVVHLTAYAVQDHRLTAMAFTTGWDPTELSQTGAKPDIWIPDAHYEVAAVRQNPLPGVRLDELGSIGDSPLVVGVRQSLVSADSLTRLGQDQPWAILYHTLSADGINLAMPDPESSDAGLFHITDLYRSVASQTDQRAIEAAGNFPPDSESLLCDARQAGMSANTAYLVSEAALLSYNYNVVQSLPGLCPTAAPTEQLTAFYPAETAALDFPFTVVDWGGKHSAARQQYEEDFYHWLRGPGNSYLTNAGIRSRGCQDGGIVSAYGGVDYDRSCAVLSTLSAPSADAANRALMMFEQARAPAHLLIGIDDSWTMGPYLHQITADLTGALAPNLALLGDRDSFSIWEFPGSAGQTYKPLVTFEPATGANRQKALQQTEQPSALVPHDNSAIYDMLVAAAGLLDGHFTAAPDEVAPVNAVVMLTDGDGYPLGDPGGHNAHSVIRSFGSSQIGGSRPIKLLIIAFGPAGCTARLLSIAKATLGTCYPADAGDPQQLVQIVGQLSAGGASR